MIFIFVISLSTKVKRKIISWADLFINTPGARKKTPGLSAGHSEYNSLLN